MSIFFKGFTSFWRLFSPSNESIFYEFDDHTDTINEELFESSSQLKSDNLFDESIINPASGLPMVGGISGLDLEGNPYGVDNDPFSGATETSISAFDESSGVDLFEHNSWGDSW